MIDFVRVLVGKGFALKLNRSVSIISKSLIEINPLGA